MKRLLYLVGCLIVAAVIVVIYRQKMQERFATTTDPKLSINIGAFRNALKDFSSKSTSLFKNLDSLSKILDTQKHKDMLKKILDGLTVYFAATTGLQGYFVATKDIEAVQLFANGLRSNINSISSDVLATKGNDAIFKIKQLQASVKAILDTGNALVADADKAQKDSKQRQKEEQQKQAVLNKAKDKAQKELEKTNEKIKAEADKKQQKMEAEKKKAQAAIETRKKEIATASEETYAQIQSLPTTIFQNVFFLTQPVTLRVFLQNGYKSNNEIAASFTTAQGKLLIDTYSQTASSSFIYNPIKKVKEYFQQAPSITPGFYLKHLQSQLYVGRGLLEDGTIATDLATKVTKFSPYTYTEADKRISFTLDSNSAVKEKKTGNCMSPLGDYVVTILKVLDAIQANKINNYKLETKDNTQKMLDLISLLPADFQTKILEQTNKLREKNLTLGTSNDTTVINTALADILKAGDSIEKEIYKSQFIPAIKSLNEDVVQSWEPDWYQYLTSVVGVVPNVNCNMPIKMDSWDGPVGAFTFQDNGVTKVLAPLPDAFYPETSRSDDPYLPENIFVGRPIRLASPDQTTNTYHLMIRQHDEQTLNYFRSKIKEALQSLKVKSLTTAARFNSSKNVETSTTCGPTVNKVCPTSGLQQCCGDDSSCSNDNCARNRNNELQTYDGAIFIAEDQENATSEWIPFAQTFNDPVDYIAVRKVIKNGVPTMQAISLDGNNIVTARSLSNCEVMINAYGKSPNLKPVSVKDPENATGRFYWANEAYLSMTKTNLNMFTPVIQVLAKDQNGNTVVVGNFRLDAKGAVECFGTAYPTLFYPEDQESGQLEVYSSTNSVGSQQDAAAACTSINAVLASRDQLAESNRLGMNSQDAYWLSDSAYPYKVGLPSDNSLKKSQNFKNRVCVNKKECETNVMPGDMALTNKGIYRDANTNSAKPLCYGAKPKRGTYSITDFKNGQYSRWDQFVNELADIDANQAKVVGKQTKKQPTTQPYTKPLSFNNWRDWNSFDSFPISMTTNGMNIQSSLFTDKTRTNYFPFKIVTLGYLKSLGYVTDPDWVHCDEGDIWMYRVDIPKTSIWAPVGDVYVNSSRVNMSTQTDSVPVLLVYNKAPYSISIDAGNWSGISDSWKCGAPGQLRWSAVLNDSNFGPNGQYAVIGSAITRYSKGQNPIEERGYDKTINAVNKLYLKKLGANDRDWRWTMGEEHSGCGKDHVFYYTTPFNTATLNSNNFCRWCNGNKPFWDIVPQTTPLPQSGGL